MTKIFKIQMARADQLSLLFVSNKKLKSNAYCTIYVIFKIIVF